MFKRIASVVSCIVSGMWLAVQPGWEPALTFTILALTYVGVEISQYRKGKKKCEDRDHIRLPQPTVQRAAEPEADLTPDALAVLRVAVSEYPNRLLCEEFRERCGLDRLHVDMAILELQKRGFLGEANRHLPNTRSRDPNSPRHSSYPLLEAGARYVEKKESAQPGAGDNPVGAQPSRKG